MRVVAARLEKDARPVRPGGLEGLEERLAGDVTGEVLATLGNRAIVVVTVEVDRTASAALVGEDTGEAS